MHRGALGFPMQNKITCAPPNIVSQGLSPHFDTLGNDPFHLPSHGVAQPQQEAASGQKEILSGLLSTFPWLTRYLQTGSIQQDRLRTFRIPAAGKRCSYGFTRSFYYEAERRGLLKLIRVRKKGNIRGITLVNASDVERMILQNQQ